MDWVCSCGSVAGEHVAYCPTCGRIGSFFPLVRRPGSVTRQGVVRLSGADLAARASRSVRPGGIWDRMFVEGIQIPAFILVFGAPGSGKTTAALELADEWKGRALVLPYEQGLGPALAQLVRRIEATRPEFALTSTWDETVELIREFDLVVVDSLQRSGVDPDDWRAAVVEEGGKTLLMTSEVNAEGEVRGGLAASHLADVSVEMTEFGLFEIRKNRFGKCGPGTWRVPVEAN